MNESGNVLLTGQGKEEPGIPVFDVTSAPAEFVAENPDLLADFPRITADAEAIWADTANHATMLPAPRHHPENAARPAS